LKATRSKRISRKRKPAVSKKRPAKTVGADWALQPFPTVGIGTSAGGLSALEKFFRAVPAGSGMAFVVVQHLDPHHKGMLPELLQRTTPMPVTAAKSGMTVRRDCVYVIPPNRDMTIRDGRLHLTKLAKTSRGLSLPIDRFFSSLADNSRQLAIGIVLSGMGMDGTLGCRDIRARGGFVGVQDPHSAEFDSMPRSVVDSKHVDAVALVEELPDRSWPAITTSPQQAAPRRTWT
jgi:two-component system CheB/CheR fusion protein